uniref:Furin-like_2 domain-containing protein n=1 Tax=Steinernema glaseri TaxID=37863 RepID=A0A1I8AI11_9BILA
MLSVVVDRNKSVLNSDMIRCTLPRRFADRHLSGLKSLLHGFSLHLVGTVSEEPPQTLSVGDLRSVQNCHPECQGCSEQQSATSCFACKHLTQTLRNRAGFKCVSRCEDGFYVDGDKCKVCSAHCKTCTKAEVCATCPGAQLLIDVDHYGHFDHGQCVEKCPAGLIADFFQFI